MTTPPRKPLFLLPRVMTAVVIGLNFALLGRQPGDYDVALFSIVGMLALILEFLLRIASKLHDQP